MRADGILFDARVKRRHMCFLVVAAAILALLVCGCSKILKDNKQNNLKQNIKIIESKAAQREPVQGNDENSKNTASYHNEEELESRPVIDYLKLSISTYNSISVLLKGRKNISDIKWSNDKSQVAFGVYDEYSYADEAFMFIWRVGAKEPIKIDSPKDRYCNFFWSPDDKYIIADTGTSVLRTGYIISVRQQKKVDQISYVFNALWSPDSNSIVIGKRRELKTKVATELDGTVDVISYDFINKKERMIAQGSVNSYCMPVEWDKDGRLIYSNRYFDNHLDESFKYSKTGSDFSMDSKLTELYDKFSKNRSWELLSGLGPLDICKIYLKAEDSSDYETMYWLYYREDDYIVPLMDKFLYDIKNDSTGKQASRKFLRSLRHDVELIEIYTSDKETNIVFNFKNTNKEDNRKNFVLLKSSGGMWKVRYLPMK